MSTLPLYWTIKTESKLVSDDRKIERSEQVDSMQMMTSLLTIDFAFSCLEWVPGCSQVLHWCNHYHFGNYYYYYYYFIKQNHYFQDYYSTHYHNHNYCHFDSNRCMRGMWKQTDYITLLFRMYLSNYLRPCGANVEDSNSQDQNAVHPVHANTRTTVSGFFFFEFVQMDWSF